LVRTPPFWQRQVLDVQVSAVKDDGIAVVQQSSVRRRQAIAAAGCGNSIDAWTEWLAAQSNLKIAGLEEFRPVENDGCLMLGDRLKWALGRPAYLLVSFLVCYYIFAIF
jgi:hypothetical protein